MFQSFDDNFESCSEIKSLKNVYEFTYSNEEKFIQQNIQPLLIFKKLSNFNGNFSIEFYFIYNDFNDQMSLCQQKSYIFNGQFIIYTFSCKKPISGGMKAHLAIELEDCQQINNLYLCELFIN